jgi:hypothetical protein
MPYFCPITGARLIAPGVSKGAGGTVLEHDGSPEHCAAEEQAIAALASGRLSPTEKAPTADAIAASVSAARAVAEPPRGDEAPEAGTIARLWYDRAIAMRADAEAGQQANAELRRARDEMYAVLSDVDEWIRAQPIFVDPGLTLVGKLDALFARLTAPALPAAHIEPPPAATQPSSVEAIAGDTVLDTAVPKPLKPSTASPKRGDR